MKIILEQNREMENTTCQFEQQKKTVNEQLLTEKNFQIEKDSGVFDRLSENFSVYRSGSTSRSPSVCSGLQIAPTSADTTSSSAYASATTSCCDSSRQRSEATARSGYSDRVPYHPKVTNALPSELCCSAHPRSPLNPAVPTTFSQSRPRSREGSSTSLKSDYSSDVGRYLYDVETDKVYEKKRLLGKGGFARVYEVSEVDKEGHVLSETTMAAKIISKSRIAQPHQREKVDIEVEIMSEACGHPNVLNLLGTFEDENCICIMVELCRKKSLAQYLRRKQYLAEAEVSLIMHQAVSGLMHLHSKGIIHRDLKLGNILLTNDMQVKIGDFGLATRLEWERKKTICGTPNFIAPEVLQRQGHGTEADIWALGCLLYTLLVGKPPFETASLRDTYRCIMKNSYRIPSTVSSEAADLISWMLSPKPKARPTLSQIAVHPFFQKHLSALQSLQKPQDGNIFFKRGDVSRKSSHASILSEKSLTNTSRATPSTSLASNGGAAAGKEQFGRSAVKRFASRIYKKLNKASARSGLQESKKSAKKDDSQREVNIPENANASEDIKTPQTWVNKWVDYSNRYGFGYQLASGKICVLFNDDKHIALLPDGKTMEYSSNERTKPIRFSIEAVPTCISKYAAILQNFTTYMDRNLRPSKDVANYAEETDHVRLLSWYRTTEYVAMCFNDGTLQINFTQNHVKVNISSLHNASSIRIALVNPEREMKVYSGKEFLAIADSEMRKTFKIIHQQFHSFFADADCSSHPFCGICRKL